MQSPKVAHRVAVACRSSQSGSVAPQTSGRDWNGCGRDETTIDELVMSRPKGRPAPAGRSRMGTVDLVSVAERKRNQHHWFIFNRVQPSSRLIATSNNSTQPC
jgi:hypothetical protein